ncbi:hypothetical protein Taro_013819 [Colocasia esculenta]|uniref:Uncharacterized protein n=1 Tax=Colocasia esculenta TaxID=4460 RepID=A0A843U7H0_COLES|nr:hypothetical protein [Colocasia esculenta]
MIYVLILQVYTDFVMVVSTHPLLASHKERDQTSPEKGLAAAEKETGEQSSAVWKENVYTDFVMVVSTHPLLVSTQCFKPKAK